MSLQSDDPAVRATEIRAMATAHLDRYVSTDGEKGFEFYGFPSLVLTTTGRRSGQPRRTPLIFGEDAGRHAVVASFAGLPTHPAWYLNLEANPDVHVQVKHERFPARARTTTGAERARLWELMLGVYPPYAGYQAKTEREIPVVVLERR